MSWGWMLDSPGAFEPRDEVRQATLRRVEGVQASLRAHHRAQCERLAASTSAEVHHHLPAARRDQPGEQLAGLVLHLDLAFQEQGMLLQCRLVG